MTKASTRTAALAATAAALLAAGPAAAAETTPPVVQSLEVIGPPTVDTTYSYGGPKVRVRITDAGSGVDPVYSAVDAVYARAASAHPASVASGRTASTGSLTRISGTAADGIYEGPLTAEGGTRGTWSISIRAADLDGNRTTLTTAQIAAKGWRSSFDTDTTTAPAAPRITVNVIYPWFFYPHIGANLTFWIPDGTPDTSGAIRVRYNAACGTPTAAGPYDFGDSYLDKRFAEKCTVTYRVVNAAGASPETTFSFR